jgi:hypothetical protein
MSSPTSLLDDLRQQYEAARVSPHDHAEVPGFQEIDKGLRAGFRWLEKAIAYLDGIKPPVAHRFELGHGVAFDRPRFERGFVGQHEQRIVGYPVIDEINVSYTIAASPSAPVEVAPGAVLAFEKILDDAGLQYSARRVEDAGGALQRCAIALAPSIPAAVSMKPDYRTGLVTVFLVNVDRFDRVTLEFRSGDLTEPALEDLVRLILGRSDAFLHRAPLAGLHGRPAG